MEAKDYLKENVTCALKKDSTVYVSEKTGIKPMMLWLSEGKDLSGFSAADKIVGKAAAMLFVKAGIKEVYARVLSINGKKYLEKHGIPVTYETLTDVIINRKGDGMCPMEQTVFDIDDSEEGYKALKRKMQELMKK